jgi:predicted dehydrogenase
MGKMLIFNAPIPASHMQMGGRSYLNVTRRSMNKNIAVVGCGYWGKNLVRNIAQLGALHTVCDLEQQKLEKLKPVYPSVNVETDYKKVLENNEVKGVVIASPVGQHYPMARQALLAGKDVFVEKPLTSNSADALELVELAEKQELILMVGHIMLYQPAVQRLKKHVKAGDLGDIYYLYSTRVNLGQVRSDESALWRLVPHDISMMLYLLDMNPEVMDAQGISYVQPGLEDVVFVTLKFSQNILANIHASWLDPHKIRQLTVVGSKKMAVFDDMEQELKLKIYDKGVAAGYDMSSLAGTLPLRSEGVYISQVDLTETLLLECQHFLDCIEKRKQPLSDGKQGVIVVQTLEKIQQLLSRD